MPRRDRITYQTSTEDREGRADEKARIAAQCRLSEQLVANPEQIAFVVGFLTHASLPGVIDGIGEKARRYFEPTT
jgi:hypothetical protein